METAQGPLVTVYMVPWAVGFEPSEKKTSLSAPHASNKRPLFYNKLTLFYNQERRDKEKKIHLFLLVDATQVSGVGGRLGLWGSALSGLGSHTYKTGRQDPIGMHMARS